MARLDRNPGVQTILEVAAEQLSADQMDELDDLSDAELADELFILPREDGELIELLERAEPTEPLSDRDWPWDGGECRRCGAGASLDAEKLCARCSDALSLQATLETTNLLLAELLRTQRALLEFRVAEETYPDAPDSIGDWDETIPDSETN